MKLGLSILALLCAVLSSIAQPLTVSELAWPTIGTGDAPPLLPSRTFWLAADTNVFVDLGVTMATNNQTVEQWSDQSATAYNVTNLGAATRPTLLTNQLNGLPIVRFIGSKFLLNSSRTVNQPVTFIFVVKFTTSPAVVDQFVIRDIVNGRGFGRTLAGTNVAEFFSFGTPIVVDGLITNGTARLLTMVMDGANSQIRVDGVQTVTGNCGAGNMAELLIGSDNSSFDLAEVIRYELATPSLSQILIDEAYLRTKWGL